MRRESTGIDAGSGRGPHELKFDARQNWREDPPFASRRISRHVLTIFAELDHAARFLLPDKA